MQWVTTNNVFNPYDFNETNIQVRWSFKNHLIILEKRYLCCSCWGTFSRYIMLLGVRDVVGFVTKRYLDLLCNNKRGTRSDRYRLLQRLEGGLKTSNWVLCNGWTFPCLFCLQSFLINDLQIYFSKDSY